VPRPHPVLLDKDRSHGHITSTDQIGMQRVLTVLAHKEQPLVGSIPTCSVPTPRTGLTARVRVNRDRHALLQQGFVGNHAVQLGKGPPRLHHIGAALPLARLLASASSAALTNIGQVFEPDQAVRIACHNPRTDHMVAILLQLSRSSADAQEFPPGGTRAFVLQPFSRDHA
jgi:hypothetical protein